MVGEKIAGIWVVWNLESDEWFADLPVVVQLKSGRRLEVCWEKFDDLSITWNTIDTNVTPRARVEWPLERRRDALPPFSPVVGATVREFAATRSPFTMQNVNHPREVSSTWLTTGLWIGTTAAGLHIVTALDENGASSEDLACDRTCGVPPL
ncbi:MAG: hypothetical protein DI630_29895 [Gordonia sp. (in: high G+C Gram-positive bacteria)]|nr:MAG: hypothetical protein DI630_29895 [Gordonia sp. (in: high G+C Gram-positive bacteria)]